MMAWNPVFSCFLAVSLLVAPTLATICPDSCVCSTTRDGLHRAICSNLAELYKFSLRQKHHNINILDLSHNNITKLDHELDRLTEIVTLDLSTNGIQNLNKFLHNAKKLVHLNLANNRIKELSIAHLPASVSSLDLTNNLLRDVPSNLEHLRSLEHLELEGNPINCSCENILHRDRLVMNNVVIDNVKCSSPEKLKSRSWLELKTKDVCKAVKTELNFLDMMMGDQPIDAAQIAEESNALKSMPLVAKSELEDGKVIKSEDVADDDDSLLFLKVGRSTSPSPIHDFEGSGSGESTTLTDFLIEPKMSPRFHSDLFAADEIIPADNIQTTEDPLDDLIDGSGEGSGESEDFGSDLFNEDTTTIVYEELETHRVPTIPEDDSTTEYPIPKPPGIFQGVLRNEEPSSSTEKTTSTTARDTTVSEQIRVTVASEVHGQKPADEEDNPTPHKTGTYVCIAIIVVLLVGLIGFAIVKGQMRKRRDRRLMRQQKRDVEKASKEMVDMNKSLLGKPANIEHPIEKKVNGKYELVPTHEPHQKKGENGDVANGINHAENNDTKSDSPRDTNQNRNSSKDNNITQQTPSQQESSFESAPASPDSRKDDNSLSSDDLFVPLNDDENPRLNGTNDSDISQPLLNGDPNTDSDFLSPSREYVPVYSPDMGRVRIKMTETPKPKTPTLVTRSRSNAGDIIITPSDNTNSFKSTT